MEGLSVHARWAACAITVYALTFSDARCQSSYETISNQASDQPQTFQSGLLGISFTYPRSLVTVPGFPRVRKDDVPKEGIQNHTECFKSIGDDLTAIRNMRTDDPDALKRARQGPEATKALASEEAKWPGVVARISIVHLSLACMPKEVYAHLMIS